MPSGIWPIVFLAAAWCAHATPLMRNKVKQSVSIMSDGDLAKIQPSAATTMSSALIRAWFDEHGLSDWVKKLRHANSGIGDGIADPDGGAEWTYFLNSCMQQRQQAVAREVLDRKCQRVIEVGGYLTPLDSFLQKLHANESVTLPAEYLNIDPSVKAARITKVGGMRSVHVPMTVADFMSESTQSFRNLFQLEGDANTCLVVLSIWDPHVKTHSDRLALGMLLRNVSFAALASANDEMKHLKVVEELAGLRGLKLEPNKSMEFDCREALSNEKTHYPGDEIENLDIMSQDFNTSHASSLVDIEASRSLGSTSQRRDLRFRHIRLLSRLHAQRSVQTK